MNNFERFPVRTGQEPPAIKRHHTPRYYAHRVRESLTTRVSKLICAIFLIILLVVGIVFFILWLSLRPHRPRIFIQDFSVPGLGQPNGFENALITFNVTARNSNQHIGFHYDNVEGLGPGALFDNDEGLGFAAASRDLALELQGLDPHADVGLGSKRANAFRDEGASGVSSRLQPHGQPPWFLMPLELCLIILQSDYLECFDVF
ncbi:hypothetical protein GH714_020562 [Hevea brasiliensis]|uniref:Late embryogenesis abundant protein LEA-2 subgroup domain-containing protein n=1 Tax=Hevea brasiliensis TaxID=3981 RepID=A0A6A6LRH5_HEVBR|nr:hypothetical protein GH714_020562 [Hevea brasiliensis]